MKKIITLLFVMMMPFMLFGQSYASLWKKVEQAGDKDLPQTEYELLQKIVAKAEKGRDYGQLLKASLLSAQVMASIAPDSLKPAMEEMKLKCEATTDEVLRTVWQTVLWRVCSRNYRLDMMVERPKLTEALCERLAQVKDKAYAPFVIQGADASIFNNDLLHVIGYELDSDFETLYQYYKKVGNRRAACIVAAQAYEYADKDKLDALIREYEDLPEVGELALVRYRRIAYDAKGEKYDYICETLDKWGRRWPRLAILDNDKAEMTNPQFRLSYDLQVSLPGRSQKVTLTDVRNVKTITTTVYKVNARGDIDAAPNTSKGYQKIKPLLDGVVFEQKRDYTGRQPYELFEDSMTIEGLPVGVYMVEFRSSPSTDVVRHLYYVTDVYTIAEDQPAHEGVRYVVVNATTGQPIAGAHLRIREYTSYAHFEEYSAVTDEKGEYLFKSPDTTARRQEVFAWTDQDDACPPMNNGNQYRYYQNQPVANRVCIFTDRAIYRPGQKVFASALLYQVTNGMDQKVRDGKSVTFQLRDANYKVVGEQSATTDAYGMCSTEFTLPSSGLTGMFSIMVNGETHRFRVEEYKRPTFHVDFPEVKQAYAAGDTLTVKASALSYAGVPVQGAKVSYKVVRRRAYWWWSYNRYWDTSVIGHTSDGDLLFESETVTDNDGQFDVSMPLTMPETSYPMFYQFVVTADVTDSAGETRTGQLSLPLGNRKQALCVDMAEKVLIDDKPTVTFHLLNAAGKDLDAEVKYRIDNGKWQTAKTAISISLTSHLSPLTSGIHALEAVCQNDTIEREFVVFSLDDERPATKTDDWFWQSSTQFTNDGKPVTIQVGSSDPDVHIVYGVFAGNKVIKRGAVDRSDQLLNLKLTYEEDYGNGLLLTFAWVKNGQCHTHTAEILRPLPDKKLRLEWSTFRDRLTPGQQEEWTLSVKDCDGKPVDAQLMATLYDQSLDQLTRHQWSLTPYIYLPLPSISWAYPSRYRQSASAYRSLDRQAINDLEFSSFDDSVYPSSYGYRFRRYSRGAVLEEARAGAVLAEPMMRSKMVEDAEVASNDAVDGEVLKAKEVAGEPDSQEEAQPDQVQMRENLNETAFFYPQLTTDKQGRVVVKFTLPESLTTWRFMGLAHTKDLYYGMLEGETVAQKDVMIQPNVPRFVREGDEATISARIFNTSKKNLTGKAVLKLINPETNAIVSELSQTVNLKAGETVPVSFTLSPLTSDLSLLICQMSVSGKGFSDGEQHYLPVLPAKERVTVTLPITQHHAGTETFDLSQLIPADGTNGKMTFEYTNKPVWLMIQALPTVGTPFDDNAISQAASLYANAIGRYILQHNPQAKTAFALWKQEAENSQFSSLNSQLEKNQELKDLLLNETPWVMDAERETEQRHRLGDFFDENLMNNRLTSAIGKLNKLQRVDGSWSWWQDMPGSFYMTVAVSEMLVRLNAMAGAQQETREMLSNAFDFMGKEIVEEVREMKEREKEGHSVSFPSFKALQWLYLATLDGRQLPDNVQSANDYLLKLLKKEIKSQTIYEKALTAVILSKPDPKRAAEYAQSLKEYTVYREDMGRYYDTPRAGYSWYDYKIPTQTIAIEALQMLMPNDRQTIEEMQRWLLQEKRTQAWDTPINSVNAVYAFLGAHDGQDDRLRLDAAQAEVQVDGQAIELPKATAAIGYVKTPIAADSKTLTIAKTTEDTSWGAVYAQFVQATHNIAASASGITVKREYLDAKGNLLPLTSHSSPLRVGDRIKVRITITADRDYGFVQVQDKRAACLEPVRQLSGWHSGSYCTPKDYSTNFYFDCLSKGTHTIENEYYVDRAGCYETGTCVVECAYAPEFRGIAPSQTLTINK